MKVMISIDNYFACYFVRLGLARAMTAMGHDVVLWDINKRTAFDAFDDNNPDLFIGQTYNTNKAIVKCIEERPEMKVVMKAGDWGPFTDTLNKEKYPILTANAEEKHIIRELQEKTGKPDFLYIHYCDDRLDATHGHWRKEGFRVESMLFAADIFDFTNGEFRPEYETDVVFVGGYWPYKAINLDRYILRLCRPNSGIRVKLFGNQPWPGAHYCGKIPGGDVKHAFSSSLICPNVSEPHSTMFGFDIIERPIKALANKCFVISDNVADLSKMYGPGCLVIADTPQDFEHQVRHFIKNPEERLSYISKGFEETMSKHTYFHRAAHMFDILGIEHKSEETLSEIRTKLEII